MASAATQPEPGNRTADRANEAWEHESRCVEIATGVFETWCQRSELNRQIEQLDAETVLPDEAPGQLVQIDAMMDERRNATGRDQDQAAGDP